MGIKKAEVVAFLREYAKALHEGDHEAVRAAWHAPSLIVDRDGALALREAGVIAVASNGRDGEQVTCPKLRALELTKISRSVVAAAVTWSYVNGEKRPTGKEMAYYVISRAGRSGRLGIGLYSPLE